ncbi:MAG: nucleoside kinase, partial [Anaerolineales bacterium]
MKDAPDIRFVSPRSTIEIHLPENVVISGPRGSNVGTLLQILEDTQDAPIVGAIVNNQLRELTYPILMDSLVLPVTMAQADGMRFYRRSLTFLLESAFEELFPNAFLTIDHSVSSGGYFCQVFNRAPLSEDELSLLENKMKTLVDQNIPFKRREVPIAEAIDYFEQKGYSDKVLLLKNRKKEHLVLYSFGDHQDYHHGYMVPSSGYLKWFRLIPTGEGFTLHFPRRHRPTELQPMPEYPTLLSTFHQYGDWLRRMGVDSVGALNEMIKNQRHPEIILVSEALHEMRIAEIAGTIAD